MSETADPGRPDAWKQRRPDSESLVAIRVSDLLAPERVVVGPPELTSRKRALETLSKLLAASREPPSQRLVFDQLCARERLGSTGLGFRRGHPPRSRTGTRGCVRSFHTG